MTINDFKKGDKVKLLTGGPIMTVDGIQREFNKLYCVWFVGSDMKDAKFSPESLEKVEG